jgi:hypothetical protein
MKAAPLQKIQDEQGFLVVARWDEKADYVFTPGEVIESLDGGRDFLSVDGPVRVIGPATREEFERQHMTYLGPVSNWPDRGVFAKVVTE